VCCAYTSTNILNPVKRLAYIVIGDDDPDDFDLLKEAIWQVTNNVLVVQAENGEILLQILSEKVPDLLFLDIVMPCKDGMACMKIIRANARFDDMLIIMYAGSSTKDLITFCYENGATLFLNKPSSYSKLVAMMERVFSIDLAPTTKATKREDFFISET
jgi:DNA-binding NtrC family response regulator